MRLRPAVFAALIMIVTGCSQFPELDDAVDDSTREAPYMALVPVENLQRRIDDPRIEDDTQSTLEARAAQLKGRAARLRGTVIDDGARQRMADGVTR